MTVQFIQVNQINTQRYYDTFHQDAGWRRIFIGLVNIILENSSLAIIYHLKMRGLT